MSVYPCEDFAEKVNSDYKHPMNSDDCLVCKALENDDYVDTTWWCIDCDYVDPDYVCLDCKHEFEEESNIEKDFKRIEKLAKIK